MISIRREPTVTVSGYELTVVVRIIRTSNARNAGWMLAVDKRPIAIICRTEGSEQIFDMEGRQMGAVELDELMTGQRA